MKFRPHRFPL